MKHRKDLHVIARKAEWKRIEALLDADAITGGDHYNRMRIKFKSNVSSLRRLGYAVNQYGSQDEFHVYWGDS